MQNPIARSTSAWCPGGRTSAKPPTSTARMAHPAASRAAAQVVGWPIVSLSSQHSSESAAMRATWSRSWARSIAAPARSAALELRPERVEEAERRSSVLDDGGDLSGAAAPSPGG